ncbi:MAG: Nicotinamide-nucleotide amidohydrolase PncC [bacterium ADurb.Bin243]|nr:MAG: Nicotinamide-nucleotide amidohydrolase PncC [bacterium ADurb.Bin243]
MYKEYNIDTNKNIARLVFARLKDIRKSSFLTPKLMFAESLTGGMLSDYMTGVPGVSEFYKGSVVAYCNTLKTSILKVGEETLKKFGAVSAETAREMVSALGSIYGADIGVSVTGIAGPGGGSALKPVGLVYFGFYAKGEIYVCRKVFSGGRDAIRRQASHFALLELLKFLNGRAEIFTGIASARTGGQFFKDIISN